MRVEAGWCDTTVQHPWETDESKHKAESMQTFLCDVFSHVFLTYIIVEIDLHISHHRTGALLPFKRNNFVNRDTTLAKLGYKDERSYTFLTKEKLFKGSFHTNDKNPYISSSTTSSRNILIFFY